MGHHTKSGPITESLEDYLETIYELIRDKQVARVKDIAKARDVRMASVSPAMHRLQDLGLIVYNRREFIQLTPKGKQIALKVIAHHEILRRFLCDFLHVDKNIAEEDACQIEHHISDQTIDRLVRFFEFMDTCPLGIQVQELFKNCAEVNPELPACEEECARRTSYLRQEREQSNSRLSELEPGEKGKITHIKAMGALRQRLIDMGLLPQTVVEVERVAPSGDPIWLKVRGFNISLRKKEANGILVVRQAQA